MSCGSILLQPCLSRNGIHSIAADKTRTPVPKIGVRLDKAGYGEMLTPV
jgi:hypothetical protein